jgi:hypothetical protein
MRVPDGRGTLCGRADTHVGPNRCDEAAAGSVLETLVGEQNLLGQTPKMLRQPSGCAQYRLFAQQLGTPQP